MRDAIECRDQEVRNGKRPEFARGAEEEAYIRLKHSRIRGTNSHQLELLASSPWMR